MEFGSGERDFLSAALASGGDLYFLDTRTDRAKSLYPHIDDRLAFFSLTHRSLSTPPIEFVVSVNQHGYQGIVWDLIGELGVLPYITIKLRHQLGIFLF